MGMGNVHKLSMPTNVHKKPFSANLDIVHGRILETCWKFGGMIAFSVCGVNGVFDNSGRAWMVLVRLGGTARPTGGGNALAARSNMQVV